MPKQKDILVRMDDQTYHLSADDPVSLKKIPWPQRKRLIEVLEAMKKAEFVDAGTAEKSKDEPISKTPPTKTHTSKLIAQTKSSTPKPPVQDSDAMMQRFLAEQQNYKSSVPSKASVYKWFLIIFAIIFVLVLIL